MRNTDVACGALVDSIPFDQSLVGSNPALAPTCVSRISILEVLAPNGAVQIVVFTLEFTLGPTR